MKSRIDFFLNPSFLIASTKTVDNKTAIAPDHKDIRLFLQFESKKKGPGLWKFNNSLLNDDTFLIGHFRITSGVFLEASLGAHLSYANQFSFTCKLNSFSCE